MTLQSLTWKTSKSGNAFVGRSPTHVADVWKNGEQYRWAVMSIDSKNGYGMGYAKDEAEAKEKAETVALNKTL